MVLHEVAQRAGRVVVAGARADPDVLRARDLDVVDVVPVPDRLEHHVREPERHHVLDGLLAQVVVDPEDLTLAEHVGDDALERARRLEVDAERLLDDHAHVDLLVAVQPGRLELLDDHREELRRRREVVVAVQRLAGRLVELRERLRERRVPRGVVEVRRDVLDVLEQAVEHLLVRLAPRVLAGSTRAPCRGTPGRPSRAARRRSARTARAARPRARGCRARAAACGARGRPSRRRSRASSAGPGAARALLRAGSPRSSWSCRPLDRVPAELVAQRREHAVRVVALVARVEARVQRGRDDRRRDVVGRSSRRSSSGPRRSPTRGP